MLKHSFNNFELFSFMKRSETDKRIFEYDRSAQLLLHEKLNNEKCYNCTVVSLFYRITILLLKT
jgi:hypothetical protein